MANDYSSWEKWKNDHPNAYTGHIDAKIYKTTQAVEDYYDGPF